MRHSIVLLDRAISDAEAIVRWLCERSPEGAERWIAALREVINRVAEHPDMFGEAPEAGALDRGLRQFLFKTRRGRAYRGIFLVIGREVRILRIRGPGQPVLRTKDLD